MTEEEIYHGCLRGDGSARRELYCRFGPAMMATALRYMADRDEAEDVLHDVFVNVLTRFDRFHWRGNGSLPAWLSRLTVNSAIDRLRSRPTFIEIDEIPEMEEVDADRADAVPESVIMAMIGQLPTGYRTVFNLYVIEGLSHSEIARQLGIAEKSSSSQLARAKALMAKKINEYLKKREAI